MPSESCGNHHDLDANASFEELEYFYDNEFRRSPTLNSPFGEQRSCDLIKTISIDYIYAIVLAMLSALFLLRKKPIKRQYLIILISVLMAVFIGVYIFYIRRTYFLF